VKINLFISNMLFNFELNKGSALSMVQTENNIRLIAPVESPVLYWSEQPLYKALPELRQGFLSYLFPVLDYIEANPKRSVSIKDYTERLTVSRPRKLKMIRTYYLKNQLK
jgi:hypothetical protein